jgi:hypothetical protein
MKKDFLNRKLEQGDIILFGDINCFNVGLVKSVPESKQYSDLINYYVFYFTSSWDEVKDEPTKGMGAEVETSIGYFPVFKVNIEDIENMAMPDSEEDIGDYRKFKYALQMREKVLRGEKIIDND